MKAAGKMSFARYFPFFGESIGSSFGHLFIISLSLVDFISKCIAYQEMGTSQYEIFHDNFEWAINEYSRLRNITYLSIGVASSPTFAVLMHYVRRQFNHRETTFIRWWKMLRINATVCVLFFVSVWLIRYLVLFHGKSENWMTAACALAFLAGYGQPYLFNLLRGAIRYAKGEEPLNRGDAVMTGRRGVVLYTLVVVLGLVSFAGRSATSSPPLSDPSAAWWLKWGHAAACYACALGVIGFLFVSWADDVRLQASRLPEAAAEDELHLEVSSAGETPHAGEDGIPRSRKSSGASSSSGSEAKNRTSSGLDNHRTTLLAVIVIAILLCMTFIHKIVDSLVLRLCFHAYSAFLLVSFTFWALPLPVAKAALYSLLYEVTSISLAAPLSSFFLETESGNPGGPHFSYFFYTTVTGLVANLAGLVGIMLFAYFFAQRSYRFTFLVLNLLSMCSSLIDVVIVQRWNKKIGISDELLYWLGDAVGGEVLWMMNWMPVAIMLTKVCRPHTKPIVFSVLAAFCNFGIRTRALLAQVITRYTWPIETTLAPCDYTNLWKMLILSGVVIPLMVLLPLMFLLVPDGKLCEELDDTGKGIPIPIIVVEVEEEEEEEDDEEAGGAPAKGVVTEESHSDESVEMTCPKTNNFLPVTPTSSSVFTTPNLSPSPVGTATFR